MLGADQREAPPTPKRQPVLGSFFAGPPADARPTNGRRAPLPNANPFWGVFVAGPPADARGRPTGGAPHLQTPTLLRIAFLPTHPLALDADQGEAARGAAHRGMLRHLANNSSLAFCMRSAASVSLRSLDCRASRSTVIPGFKYSFHFFSDTNFS